MAPQNTPKTFVFRYVKLNNFKTIKIDGIIGGINAKREINMNFFVDTVDLATSVSHVVKSNNRIGDPIPLEKKTNTALRELTFGVNIDVVTAKSIVVWLNDQIKESEKLNAEIIEITNKEANKLMGN
ncbi:hypothetical protein EON73_02115 [bacterium]|nr:MAG: hypothetical protein EON73_02115 [bacterium]